MARTIGIDIVLVNATGGEVRFEASVDGNDYQDPPAPPAFMGASTLQKIHAEAYYYRKTVPIHFKINDGAFTFGYDPYNPFMEQGSVETGTGGELGYICYGTGDYNFQLVVWGAKYIEAKA
jgi:hypothetical protein